MASFKSDIEIIQNQCDQMVNFFYSLFGHLQQIKLAQQLAEIGYFFQLLYQSLKSCPKEFKDLP